MAKSKAPALGSLLHQVKFQIGSAEGDQPPAVEIIAVQTYLEKLTESVADGVLTEAEVASLADLAEVYDLDPETVENAHRVVVEGLTQMAMLDSKITNAERAELRHISTELGLGDGALKDLMAQQRAVRLLTLSEDLLELPDDWALGEPLRVGDKVAFTGGEPTIREQLEGMASRVGVEVMPSVSKATVLLVSDGLDSTKAAAAARHDVRVVTYREFVDLLKWRQATRL